MQDVKKYRRRVSDERVQRAAKGILMASAKESPIVQFVKANNPAMLQEVFDDLWQKANASGENEVPLFSARAALEADAEVIEGIITANVEGEIYLAQAGCQESESWEFLADNVEQFNQEWEEIV